MNRIGKSLFGAIAFFVLFFLLALHAAAQQTPIRVAFERDFPPYAFIDEQENPSGFIIDLLQAIAKEQELSLLFIPMSLENAISALENGEVDAIAGFKYTQKKEDEFDFSEPVLTVANVLIVNKTNNSIFNLSHLSERVVAVKKGDSNTDILENIRRVKKNEAFSQPDALALLKMDRADAFVGEKRSAEYFIQKMGWQSDLVIRSGLFVPTDYALAVRNGNASLLEKLNSGIRILHQNGTYAQLFSRWIQPLSDEAKDRLQKIITSLLTVLSVIVTISLFGLIWNQNLRSQVKRKTKTIEDHLVFQRQVLESVDNGIITLDKDLKITMSNQKAKELLEWPIQEELLNKDVLELPWFSDVLPKNMKDIREPLFFREKLISSEHTERYCDIYVDKLEDGQGNQAGWIITLRDRTEEKALNVKLVKQEKLRALGHLISGVAHEMRNPLTGIKAFVDLLPYKINDPRFREEMLFHVPEEIQRLNRIVEDLLDYTRHRELHMEMVLVNELLDSVLALLGKKIQEAEIQVERDIDPRQILSIDRQRMKQVLINLIVNAVEAMKNSPIKKLQIIGRDEQIILVDTGEGIEPETLRQLFQPFITTKTQGVGLGMFVSYSIVKQHRGDIWIDSIPSKGTKVTLVLPKEGIQFAIHTDR